MIEIYDDRVSIVSPGGVPKGITKENFGKRSIARNPIIADLLRRTHYIEKAGTGIGRMRELMEEAGLKEPEFQYDEFFETSFLRPSYYDKNYGTYDLANKNQNMVNNYKIPLSKIQQEIINIIMEIPNVTQSDIAKRLKVSRQSIATNMKELKENNVIERIGANKKGYWKIL
jgi:ATP-dependent DNA helicase RecG